MEGSGSTSTKGHSCECPFVIAIFIFLALVGTTVPANSASTPGCSPGSTDFSSAVLSVVDGDTLLTPNSQRIRLIGINAPELHQQQPNRQWAVSARRALLELTDERVISWIFEAESKDRYGRLLVHGTTPDGRLLAAELIKRGLAFAVAVGHNHRCAEFFRQLEDIARKNQLGLWEESDQWVIKTKQQISKMKGFQILQGQIIKQSERYGKVLLHLNVGALIQMEKEWLRSKFAPGINQNNLMGNYVEIRGWFFLDGDQKVVNLSHPANLSILAD